MADTTVTVQIVAKWWLPWYLAGVKLMVALTGKAPNEDRVTYWFTRGFKTRVV